MWATPSLSSRRWRYCNSENRAVMARSTIVRSRLLIMPTTCGRVLKGLKARPPLKSPRIKFRLSWQVAVAAGGLQFERSHRKGELFGPAHGAQVGLEGGFAPVRARYLVDHLAVRPEGGDGPAAFGDGGGVRGGNDQVDPELGTYLE